MGKRGRPSKLSLAMKKSWEKRKANGANAGMSTATSEVTCKAVRIKSIDYPTRDQVDTWLDIQILAAEDKLNGLLKARDSIKVACGENGKS